jgi:hypothetical protein
MSFKKFIFLLLVPTVLSSFNPGFAAINTHIRICAAKGTVKTGRVKNHGFLSKDQCLLMQEIDVTECRVVTESTMVETGADGFAVIDYPDGTSIKLRPNTIVVLEQNHIYVKSGRTWFNVEKRADNELIIEAPTAIAGIRGTEFLVNVEPDGTTNFQLIEGSVEISDSKQKSSIILNAGMEVTVQAGTSTLNTGLLKIDTKNNWWTDWPTLVPISEKPGYIGGAVGVTGGSGQKMVPVADAYVYAYNYLNWNRSNRGKYEQLVAGWHPTGGESRAYLKFDLSNFNPSSVKKAVLKLYHTQTVGNSNVTLGVYRVSDPWMEGSDTYHPGETEKTAGPGVLSWVQQPVFNNSVIATFNPGMAQNNWVEIDITPLVRQWLTGFKNNGLVIKPTDNLNSSIGESAYHFASREWNGGSNSPFLEINGEPVAGFSGTPTSSLPFFEDFSNGLSGCKVEDPNAKTDNGQLFWNTGNFLNVIFNPELPMENITIEFDGYCENNGINVFLQNEEKQGYTIIIGGWNNTQSGSDVGGEVENRELVSGKVYESGKWHHYKIKRCGDQLSVSCDNRPVFNRIVTRRFSGNGTLRFNSYNTRVGIDNVSIKKCN